MYIYVYIYIYGCVCVVKYYQMKYEDYSVPPENQFFIKNYEWLNDPFSHARLQIRSNMMSWSC